MWGLGQRPNCSSGDHFAKRAQQRCRQRSVPASNFAHPQMRPQLALPTTRTLSRQMGATDQHRETWFSCCWSFLLQGESRLRARQGGFAVAPLTPSQCTLPGLIFSAAEPTSSAFGTFPRGGKVLGARPPHGCQEEQRRATPSPAFPSGEGVAAATDEVVHPKRTALPLLGTPLCFVKPAPDA